MKFALAAALVALCGFGSAANAGTACDKWVTCGTFEGPGSARNEKGEEVQFFNETLTVTSESENTAKLMLTVFGKDPAGITYPLDMKIEANGAFTLTLRGGLYATGICKFEVCTYGMRPFKWEGYENSVANSGFLIFKKDAVERHMLVVTPVDRVMQLSILKRK